ncbi:glycoside hydrolase family 3 N-terminal domain-containing protein [Halobacillus sp. HZG1]|uniref:glycoside hydrolase family 3 N-terminal domain-containing protein n=1 Tax=Halobacillus sp. HZG1 TaxID=3111769 RepID=UPI002DB9B3FB|nr:glycoside hydrolase family 3 N-terminal domain-containing protein [Halobacillus sp. HZG1]MEC3884874.1 glycoside hydrolase family 3 N-terminal domain-containing protein [Halobacillus sp. HZG1]
MAEHQMKNLLDQMTVEEKVGQLVQLATPFFKGASDRGEITGPMVHMNIDEEDIQRTGSVLGASGAKETINIQKVHMEESRLGIPLLFMSDIVHGFKTIFPVPLAIGCSWDMELAEKSASIAAREAAVAGVHVTFAPMVDLSREPRWGRVMESTGEDTFLNSQFARSFVRGFQGDLENDPHKVASCVKHFAAYGAPEGGRDYNTVDMSEWQLRENYLPAYKAALDEGAQMVMTAFNILNGMPSTGNEPLMRGLLRDEWNFDGVLISDWGAVKELIPHGVAENEKIAAEKAMKAGVDVEMMTSCYVNHVEELIEEGTLEESILDEAVLRILQLKQKLGLFDNPYRGASEQEEDTHILSTENRKASRELATKSMVLLKNEGTLPLQQDQKVALIGPFADNTDILGPWSWGGSADDTITVASGLSQYLNENQLLTSAGCGIETGTDEQMQAALQKAEQAESIVVALGEHSDMSGEAGCRADIRIPEVQLELLKKIKSVGKPVTAVLFNGRPLDLREVIENADAVIEAWYPGTEGGNALADILFGEVNPSAKLTMSMPYSVGQVPIYYNRYNTGRPKGAPDAQERYVSQYLDIPNEPLFPFGFGMSYSRFEYNELSISSKRIRQDESLTVSIQLTNTGDYAGEEIVQLYVRDLVGEVVRPLKELKDFEKVYLHPGEQKDVHFTLTEEQLRYYHANMEYKSDAGEFEVFVGPNSRDAKSERFSLD